jgi:hypothetical protein
MKCFVYIIESLRDGSHTVGSTQNLTERMERHNQERSTYTKSKGLDVYLNPFLFLKYTIPNKLDKNQGKRQFFMPKITRLWNKNTPAI